MKFSVLSLAVIAALFSGATAKPSTPVKGCTANITVIPGSGETCDSVAASAGITFADLLKLNTGLDANCDNLDDGNTICVASTQLKISGTSFAPPAGTGSTVSASVPASTSASASFSTSASVTSAAVNSSATANITAASSSANASASVPASNANSSTSATATNSSSGAMSVSSSAGLGMMLAAAIAAFAL